MTHPLGDADRHLLELIRAGDGEGWSQLVDRYEGRLISFARRQLGQLSDAEDAVQDTFLNFLKGLSAFREQASVETYLFTILRRKIIDRLRGKHLNACSLNEQSSGADDSHTTGVLQRLASDQPAASWYARRNETDQEITDVLAKALGAVVHRYRESRNFRNLQLAELIFYAQLRNKDIAELLSINEKQVALAKHRFLNRLQNHVRDLLGAAPATDGVESSFAHDDLLTSVWEKCRPSCPKRSTIGRYLLDTLEPDWRDFVAFHLDQLGCRFCLANLDDLRNESDDSAVTALRDRIMQSTIGFLPQT